MKCLVKSPFIVAIALLALLTACSRGKQMRERMQYVAACNKADTVFTARWLPTVDSLADYFRSHGTRNERMTALYLKGRVHHDLGEAPQALDCYQRATEQADTTRSDCDLRTLYSVYGQMANLFHAQYLPDNEMETLRMAERIAWKNGDTLDALVAFDLRSRPYNLKNEKDSVMFVEKQARERYLKFGYREKAAQAIYSTTSILLDRNQISEAKLYLDLYEKESGNFDENDELIFGGHYYYNKGRYLLAIGQSDSARYYFHRALDRGQREAGYKGLLSVYEKKNISDSISKYAKLFAAANDSNFLHVNQEKIHQITAAYDYSHHQRVAEEKENEVLRLRNVISAILLAIFIVVGLFYIYRARKLARINHLAEKKTELENLLTERQREMELNLLNNLTIQEKQYEEIGQLKRQIGDFQRQISDDLAGRQRLFYDSEIYEKFMSYKNNDFSASPDKQEWNSLIAQFRDCFPRYYRFITEENKLTADQFHVCLLARMYLPVYAMARIMGVDGDRITRIKSQVNKKLFNDDAAKTLEKNLKQHFNE